MSKDMLPVKNNLPVNIKEKVYDLLSETLLNTAFEYIKKYDNETDAILFRDGLIAVKNMLIYIDKNYSKSSKQNFGLIMNELKLRVNEINKIIYGFRGKKAKPELSDNDKKIVLEIEEILKKIFNTPQNIAFDHIVTFMLEASNKKQEEMNKK